MKKHNWMSRKSAVKIEVTVTFNNGATQVRYFDTFKEAQDFAMATDALPTVKSVLIH